MVSLSNHAVGYVDRATTSSFDRLRMRSTNRLDTQECSAVQGGTLATDIVIAEDEPSILQSLEFILRRAGWSIHGVTDGDAALEAVRRLRPRIVVLDVMLPRRSGFDVLKHLRSDSDTRPIPVLILTAKGQQQDRRIAEELGADAFVTKPYANAEVVGVVRQLLGESGGPA